ncbi:phosphodiesterase [Nocardia aurantia]|uniref:3',5'-cyclic adenosine monophosphate phosphodiesterase CpdA n=1 Tax=Nocardia aurantia TaxID=2585199 RepID=A0A7K0DQN8_9NOCA|nr:phosphodiesterase [Nocardia aurantia]MQY28083.1 3',5'-cyclic adenosine monophosphate phosphodiesterase CpdA [Nocardia aurantia]
MTSVSSQHPEPEHFLLHISDTHFVGGRELLHGGVDSDANLRQVFDDFARSGARPEAIIFTGDLADTGDADAYERLRAMVEPVAAELGAKVIWVMGNHDTRQTFRVGLLDEQPSDDPIDRVHWVGGLRIIALDSTVLGHHYGEIDEAQLTWLAEELATPAPEGTILALHHPPVPSPIGLIGLVELREQNRLAAILEGSDVRAILGGHLHYSTMSTFAGIPVSVASATCYTQDLNVVFPAARGQDGGQSFNLVHVYGDRVLHSVVPVGDFPTLYEMPADQIAAFLALSQEEQTAAMTAASPR